MCTDKDSPPCEHGELIALVSRQQDQVARLTATIKELRKALAEAKQAGKRQAAPFSKGGRTNRPKRPGRKPGIGSFSYRKPPSPDEVTEPPVDVEVAGDSCPGCGGRLEYEGVQVAYVTDIPPIPRPQVTEYRVQIGRCLCCGKRVRGRHPDVAPDQYGASAHRAGRRVMAAAHVLHYGVGIPVRRVPVVLRAPPRWSVIRPPLTTGAAPPATPIGTSQETCHQDRELGRSAGQRCLPLVPRAHRRHTPHMARLLPRGIPCRIRTEATRHPGHDVRGLRRSCRRARPQARDQRRTGDGTRGAQASVHAGEPALALQLVSPAQDQAGPQARAVPLGLLARLARSPAGLETQPRMGGRVPRSSRDS